MNGYKDSFAYDLVLKRPYLTKGIMPVQSPLFVVIFVCDTDAIICGTLQI
ncbi:MAG: hypothetical protein LBP59_11375 [Planctomycetaceae bacterium]|nr:hypothetical protein [Planctomycetaceae bacterium]